MTSTKLQQNQLVAILNKHCLHCKSLQA